MQGPKQLLDCEDRWETEMGAWFAGERVVCRGKNLFSEFQGKRWMELLLFGITGREFDENEILLFEQIWVLSTNYPESRIWNNRISTLAGSSKAIPSLAAAGSIAVTDAKILGVSPVGRAVEFFVRAGNTVAQGGDVEEIALKELRKNRVLAGYGRPIIQKDERIEPLLTIAKKLGFGDGYYVNMAFEIERLLIKNRLRMCMNVGALVSALVADRGLNKMEAECWISLAFSAGNIFCFIDGLSQKEGSFFPLRCERISYEGIPHRKWEN